MAALHVGDVGVLVRLTVYEDGVAKDISTASSKSIKIRKPDGSVVTRTASFTTTGTDGQLQAATETSDLDLVGRYTAYAALTVGSWIGTTAAASFQVVAAGE